MGIVQGNAPWYEKSGMIKLSRQSLTLPGSVSAYLLTPSFDIPVGSYTSRYIKVLPYSGTIKIYINKVSPVQTIDKNSIQNSCLYFSIKLGGTYSNNSNVYYKESLDTGELKTFRIRIEGVSNDGKLVRDEICFFDTGGIQIKTTRNSVTLTSNLEGFTGSAVNFNDLDFSNLVFNYDVNTKKCNVFEAAYEDSYTDVSTIITGTAVIRTGPYSYSCDIINLYSQPPSDNVLCVHTDSSTKYMKLSASLSSKLKIDVGGVDNILVGDDLDTTSVMEWRTVYSSFSTYTDKGSITFSNLNSLDFDSSKASHLSTGDIYRVSNSFTENSKFSGYDESNPRTYPAGTYVRVIGSSNSSSTWFVISSVYEPETGVIVSGLYGRWYESYRYNYTTILERIYHIVVGAFTNVSSVESPPYSWTSTTTNIQYYYGDNHSISGFISCGSVPANNCSNFYTLGNRDLSYEGYDINNFNGICVESGTNQYSWHWLSQLSGDPGELYVKTKTAHKVI